MKKISAAAIVAAVAISAAAPAQASQQGLFWGALGVGAVVGPFAPRAYYPPPPVVYYYPPPPAYYVVPACDPRMYPYGCSGSGQGGSYPYITNSNGYR